MSTKDNDYQIKDMDCPSCDNDEAKLISHHLDIPYYEDYVMLNINCASCGFRSSDFFNLSSKGPTHYEYLVDNSSDDVTKVVRAKEGLVEIPELGIKIEPINESVSWIRNVEGVLDDMRKKLVIIINNPEDPMMRKLAEERLELLNNMIKYKTPFTLIVDDPSGNSLILPANKKKLRIKYYEEKI